MITAIAHRLKGLPRHRLVLPRRWMSEEAAKPEPVKAIPREVRRELRKNAASKPSNKHTSVTSKLALTSMIATLGGSTYWLYFMGM